MKTFLTDSPRLHFTVAICLGCGLRKCRQIKPKCPTPTYGIYFHCFVRFFAVLWILIRFTETKCNSECFILALHAFQVGISNHSQNQMKCRKNWNRKKERPEKYELFVMFSFRLRIVTIFVLSFFSQKQSNNKTNGQKIFLFIYLC